MLRRIKDQFDQQSDEIHTAVRSACFIADYLKRQTEDDDVNSCSFRFSFVIGKSNLLLQVKEDWQFIAHVFDRLLLWIFSIGCFAGTVAVLLNPKSSILNYQNPIA